MPRPLSNYAGCGPADRLLASGERDRSVRKLYVFANMDSKVHRALQVQGSVARNLRDGAELASCFVERNWRA